MKKDFLMRFLIASIFGFSLIITGCPQSQGGGDNPEPNKPDVPVAKALIAKVRLISENGGKEIPYDGAQINTKGKVQMQVTLKEGIEADGAKIEAKLSGVDVVFGEFQDNGWGGVSSVCNDVQGITSTAKEMVITVTSGKATDSMKFMLKELDETTLQNIELTSFMIGTTEVKDSVLGGNQSWKIYDPSSTTIEFTATVDKDLKQAIMVVNGKESVLQPTAEDKKVVKAKVTFEKDSVKTISFIFQAESCKDFFLNSFTLTFTNKVNAVISVDATGRGQGKALTDAEILSGNVEFDKCTTTEPKITVKAFKNQGKGTKLTLVSIDGTAQEIKTENPGEWEEYVATYTLSPQLEKAGDKKAVKLHVEGTSADGSKVNEPIDLNISFTLVQFIGASLEIEADGKPFAKIQDGYRVYSPNVKVKVISTDDELTDVVVKDYKDADGKVPSFEISEKEATASFKLKDTGMESTKIKIVLSAEGKTDTTMTISVRYTAQNDPLGIFFKSFAQGDVEEKLDDEGSHVMTGEEAKLYVLLSGSVKRLTSMKVNGVEVMGKSQADTDKVVMSAKLETTQGMSGKNNNAVFVFGGDKMIPGKVYLLNISMAGEDEDGHVLAENSLPPLKIKMPIFDPKNTDWRSPYSGGSEAMEFIEISKSFHPEDKAQMFYNYYGIRSFSFGMQPKNPKATVKGIWYRHDATASERDKILADTQEENGPYADHFLKFTTQETLRGKCKWCTTLNFDDEKFKDYGISVYLWVVSADGSATSKNKACDDTIHTAWEQNFRRLDIMCDYENHEGAAWDDVGSIKGWKHAIQVVDKAEIDYTKVVNNKLYFRATGFVWVAGAVEYHLFNDNPTSPISDFMRTSDPRNYDNRFTVDVSSLATSNEMTVEVPVFMKSLQPGKEFTANVFTRKFKIVKK